jgi:hypothetical protein
MRRESSLRRATPERNIGASLYIRPQASSIVDLSQIESHSSHHFYQSVFCFHLVIARLAGANYNAVKKKLFGRISASGGADLQTGLKVGKP